MSKITGKTYRRREKRLPSKYQPSELWKWINGHEYDD
jgi:hypothetical protein